MRRPLSLYGPSSAVAPGYDDSIRRTQSYRVLKSQPADSITPRFVQRASAADANIHRAPLSIATRAPEPAAFLTMSLEIANASSTFTDAIGRQSVNGLNLADVLVQSEGQKVFVHQRQLQEEQERKDPHYLPPIFGKQEGDRVLQGLGFSPEELSRYTLDSHDTLTFAAQDGQPRHLPIRLGLAKQDSIYFVVLVLNVAIRPLGHPTPSPHPRDMGYSYQAMPMQQQQQVYSQPTPMSATFDPARSRGMAPEPGYGPRPGAGPEAGHMPTRRQSAGPGQHTPGGIPGALINPGLSPGFPSSYAASPSRPDYPGPSSYQVPRSELALGPPPTQNPGYQLPPIRSQQQGCPPPPEIAWPPRDEKSRVDIGGLIEKPDQPTTRPR